MALKLYAASGPNANTFKVLIAAQYAGVTLDRPAFEMGVTNKTPEFLELNPIGKVPVLVTPQGPLFESCAIARYIGRLSECGLYGSSLYESACVDQWIDFGSNELSTNIFRWAGPLYGFGPRNLEAETKAKEAVFRALGSLNTFLADKTYLVGHSVTLADILTACHLYYGFMSLFSPAYMKDFPHVQRYLVTLFNKPHFKAVLGEVKQCQETPEDVLPLDKNPFAALLQRRAQQAAAAAAPAEAAKAETAEAAAPESAAPAQGTPAAAPATPAQEEDEAPSHQAPGSDSRTAGLTDEPEEPKPKAKNPLDLLPPSPMVMDAWKRLYSNTKAKDFREVAIKGFWDMYDPEGYSLWFCDYKHNSENTVKFITLNKVSGFLQRMDLCRKYAFAKMCILGPDAGPFIIRGVWLFRGPEVPKFVMDEVYDMELYEWKKVDIADEKQKELVSAMYEETDDIEGVPLVEAKCFK